MENALDITIYDEGRLVFQAALDPISELGRQNLDESPPYGKHEQSGIMRVVIARLDEVTIPRKLLRIERLGNDRAKLTNLSRVPLRLDSGPPLDPGGLREVGTPCTVSVGNKSLSLGPPGGTTQAPADSDLQSLPDSSFAPLGDDPAASLAIATLARDQINEGTIDIEALLRWIQAAQGVLQSAAGTTDFFRRAARALVDLVGLDFGCVLLHEKGSWTVHHEGRAGHVWGGGMGRAMEWEPSDKVLDCVVREKKTFWQKLDESVTTDSLIGVKSVVASPIRSPHGEIIGVLYGERRRGGPGVKPISRLVAMLVEMLASGVAAGLARLAQERTLFLWEQFVTPDLSRHLADNPDLLKGRDAEISMVSCDIRGFSRICNNLGPARALEWVNDVLKALSDCVLAEGGVLVDYVGDELLAMWGAPQSQPDHAPRACRAALAMLASVPVLNARWIETVKEPMAVSIGVNSGTARVGNVGSERKFKYGALGTTVNMTSRVQGATKYFKLPILITEAVQHRLDAGFLTRRLAQVRVINIPDPVALCQLTSADHPDWAGLKENYEQALTSFETKEFRRCARVLGALLAQGPHRDDGPSLVLMQRAVTYLVEEPKEFTPVWDLPGKGK
jgi:adenylate cyclase